MKKNFSLFLVAVAISLSACIEDIEPKTVYQAELNGVKYENGDSIYCPVGQNFRVALLENGIATPANFTFGNSTNGSGYQAFVTYNQIGNYLITIESANTAKIIKVYVIVGKTNTYTLKINNQTVVSDSAFRTTVGTRLGFKLLDTAGKKVVASYDFGNGQKISTDSVSMAYTAKGTYLFKAMVDSKIIRVNIIVSDEGAAGESIILISATVSGNTITSIFGLRCNAIAGIDVTKDVYVAGEIPGGYWKDYNINHEVTVINNISYFKWSVSAPVGNYRLSWIQLKLGKTEFKYDNCNWAYSPSSKYWNNEGLFHFATYIDGGVVKIKP